MFTLDQSASTLPLNFENLLGFAALSFMNSPHFFSSLFFRSNTSFFSVGVAVQHPPDDSVPRSVVTTCWHLSSSFLPTITDKVAPGSFFFFFFLPPQLLLAEPTVMCFTAKCRTLSYHMGLRSIFFCFYKDQKSGALFMHASLRIPSVIQDPCSEGCCYLFPSMKVLFLCYAMLMVNAVFLYAFR